MTLPQLNTLQSFSPIKTKDEDSDDKSTESLIGVMNLIVFFKFYIIKVTVSIQVFY